jgi:1-acyl-sn-glycerol-3-phosphate acyltransferase
MRPLRRPPIGARVPRRGNFLTSGAAWLNQLATGWRVVGGIPDVARFVLIVAPHTSNWDFLHGLGAKGVLRLSARFLGKHSLFRGPAGWFLRWLGGIPVDRRSAHGIVGDSVAAFEREEQLCLVLTPEGTRSHVEAWKSGFYRIAVGAGVPILLVKFDYRSKSVVLGPLFQPSGDYDRDLPLIQREFSREMARRPELYGAEHQAEGAQG